MTQKELVKLWVKEHGFIIPARMSGKIYYDTMFGSEASRVCRTLRAKGILDSERDGKFEKFYFSEKPDLDVNVWSEETIKQRKHNYHNPILI